MKFKSFFLIAIVISLFSCTNSSKPEENLNKLNINRVVIHELSDPDKLNPLCSQGAGAVYIEHNIFMYLLDVDKEKLEIVPWLAKSRPTITEITEGEFKGGLKIDYEIKEAAVWDNGTPVTAYDVAFSVKCILNPHVDAEHQKTYVDFLKDIIIDKENPKKFSFLTNEKNYAAEFFSGGTTYILPEYIYDEEKLMRNFTLKQLNNSKELERVRDDINLRKFAKSFNSENFQREVVVGSGAYYFDYWKTGENIILKKKKDWWGEKYQPAKSFENFPDEIVYKIIKDQVTATTALKDGQIGLMRSMKPSDYDNLLGNKKFNEKFILRREQSLSYTYIGINTKKEILEDKNVRKAIAHIVNVPQIIDVVNYGYAQEIASFVHPSKPHYNTDITPYEYDLEKAIEYLEKAGFVNYNDDGIRYREVDGEEQILDFTIKYNIGNERRETIALFVKQNAKKIGMNIEPKKIEWAVYLEQCKNHEIDLFLLGWIQEAIIDDPKQLFHTESYHGGSNYTGFGNEYSDKLIEDLRKELDEEKRIEMLKELQVLVYDEVPYIFLYAPDNLIAISKKFANPKTYIARPGYDERELKLAK